MLKYRFASLIKINDFINVKCQMDNISTHYSLILNKKYTYTVMKHYLINIMQRELDRGDC